MKTSLDLLGAAFLFIALAAMFFVIGLWRHCDMAWFKARRFVREFNSVDFDGIKTSLTNRHIK